MRHFRVKLHGVKTAGFIGHAGNGARGRRAHHLKAFGHLSDLVAVAHPDLEHPFAVGALKVFNAFQELRVVVGTHFGVAEFALGAAFNAAPQLLRHRLHAVADTQNRDAGLKDGVRDLVVAFFIGAHVRARKDDALRCKLSDEFGGNIIGVDFAVDVGFAHAACDELCDLTAEVENENSIVLHVWRSR